MKPGITPFAITGNATEDRLLPNKWKSLKEQGMRNMGIPLIGAEEESDIKSIAKSIGNTPIKPSLDLPVVIGSVAKASDEGFNIEDLPEPLDNTLQAFNDALEALSLLGQREAKLASVISWLARIDDNNRGVLDVLHDFSIRDAQGQRFYNIVENSMQGGEKPRGPTIEAAQTDKAKRIQSAMQLQGYDVTLEWVRDNGYRGPSAEQIKAFKMGQNPEPSRPPGPSARAPLNVDVEPLITKVVQNALGPHYTDAQSETQQEIRDWVRERVIENGNRGLDQNQVRELTNMYGRRKAQPTQGRRRIVQNPVFTHTPPAAATTTNPFRTGGNRPRVLRVPTGYSELD